MDIEIIQEIRTQRINGYLAVAEKKRAVRKPKEPKTKKEKKPKVVSDAVLAALLDAMNITLPPEE